MSPADAYGVDLEASFGRTMAELRTHLGGDPQSRNVSI